MFLEDPSFWVSAAFGLFALLGFRPLFYKIKTHIEAYRAHIEDSFKQAEDLLAQARLALQEAQKRAQETETTIQDIQKNTQEQIRHAQELFETDLAHIKTDDEKVRAYHVDILDHQLKHDLRNMLLEHTTRRIKQILRHHPLGISEAFSQKIQNLPLPKT